MFTHLIAWSLHNRPLILAQTLILCLLGGYALKQMPADVFPNLPRHKWWYKQKHLVWPRKMWKHW